MRLAVIRADGVTVWTERDTAPDLADLQALVGGYIEAVPMPKWWGPGILYANEEGICLKLRANLLASFIMCRAWTEEMFRQGLNPFAALDPTRLQLYGDVVWCERRQ